MLFDKPTRSKAPRFDYSVKCTIAMCMTSIFNANATPIIDSPINSLTTWSNETLPAQTENVHLTFSITPLLANLTGTVGVSTQNTTSMSDLAASIRLNNSGEFEAINGSRFQNDEVINYIINTRYNVRLEIDRATNTYDVFVIIANQPVVKIAEDYNLQTVLSGADTLNTFSFISAENNALTINNIELGEINENPANPVSNIETVN